jgi:hypothetical protein
MENRFIGSWIVIPPSKVWHNETCLQAKHNNYFRKLLSFTLT